MINEELIIQLTSSGATLYGLSNKGRLFYWNSNINDWTLVSQ